jgi:hypothetical protein
LGATYLHKFLLCTHHRFAIWVPVLINFPPLRYSAKQKRDVYMTSNELNKFNCRLTCHWFMWVFIEFLKSFALLSTHSSFALLSVRSSFALFPHPFVHQLHEWSKLPLSIDWFYLPIKKLWHSITVPFRVNLRVAALTKIILKKSNKK